MSSPVQETDLLSSVELSNPASFSIGDEWPAAEKCEKFVAFFLGGVLYCMASKAVAEVVHPLPVAVLPHSPAWLSGIAAFRGEVIAVINTKEMLGHGELAATRKAKLVILRSNAKETQFAIPVESMHELVAIKPQAVTSDPNASDGMTRLAEHDNNVLTMIDAEILFERLAKSFD